MSRVLPNSLHLPQDGSLRTHDALLRRKAGRLIASGWALSLLVLGACVGEDTPPSDQLSAPDGGNAGSPLPQACNDLSVSLTSPPSLIQGKTITLEVSLRRTVGKEVSLRLDPAHEGVSAPAITVSAGSSAGVLRLTAREDAPTGRQELRVVASCGELESYATTTILVRGPSGSLDTVYGTGGRANTPTAGQVGLGKVEKSTVHDGRLYIASRSGNELRLTAFNTDGSLDSERFAGGFTSAWSGPNGHATLVASGAITAQSGGMSLDTLYANGGSGSEHRAAFGRRFVAFEDSPSLEWYPTVPAGYVASENHIGFINDGDTFFHITANYQYQDDTKYIVNRRVSATGAQDPTWSRYAWEYGRTNGNDQRPLLSDRSWKAYSANNGFIFLALPVFAGTARQHCTALWIERRATAFEDGPRFRLLPNNRVDEAGVFSRMLSDSDTYGTVYLTTYAPKDGDPSLDVCISKVIDSSSDPVQLVCFASGSPSACDFSTEECGNAGPVSPLSNGRFALSFAARGAGQTLHVFDSTGSPSAGWEAGISLSSPALHVLEDDEEGVLVVHAQDAPWTIERYWL